MLTFTYCQSRRGSMLLLRKALLPGCVKKVIVLSRAPQSPDLRDERQMNADAGSDPQGTGRLQAWRQARLAIGKGGCSPLLLPRPQPHALPGRHLRSGHALLLALGMILSTDVLKTAPTVAQNVGHWHFLGLWVAGGIVSLVGALCYVEMAAAFPHAGANTALSATPGANGWARFMPGRALPSCTPAGWR
jgi:hypothetical protein